MEPAKIITEDKLIFNLAHIQNIPSYVTDLRARTGYYLGWIPNEYADQATEDSYYDIIRADTEVWRCLNLLSLMSAGEMIEIKSPIPGLKEISKFCFEQIEGFLHSRKSLVEKTVLFGLGIHRKYYSKVHYKDMDWECCTRMQEVDRRRLRIERDPENRNHLYWTIWAPLVDAFVILGSRKDWPLAPQGSCVDDYIWNYYEYEELYPYFQGAGDILYTLAYIKSKVIPYWADLAESWSKPLLIWSIDSAVASFTASLGSSAPNSTQRVNDLLAMAEKIRARHTAVIDKNDKLDLHEHGSTGNNICKELCDYIDSKIQLMLLGAELTTTAGNIGSYSQASVHKEATDTIVSYNRGQLAECLLNDLLFDFFKRNQGQMAKLGIKYPNRSEIKIKIKVEQEELQKQQQRAQGEGGKPKTAIPPKGGAN